MRPRPVLTLPFATQLQNLNININIPPKLLVQYQTKKKMEKPSLKLAALSTDPDGSRPVQPASQSKYDILSGSESFFKSVQWFVPPPLLTHPS